MLPIHDFYENIITTYSLVRCTPPLNPLSNQPLPRPPAKT
ncbi:hypothetical protein X777_03679 [Ooceraea biroi]|uniref:Uncharacterized protein n=1 Tax=Ooceraea biroi TaxID=2015173 RepID=A0A026WLL7_OOCBI|nr:hypothetical protein X777_03679 [Ooceraea biroi]